MKVAIIISDGGDGSASLLWFKDLKLADELTSDDEHCEVFGLNEGGPAEIIEVPEGWEPPCGFSDKYYEPGYEE
ncbi:hypothetical protein NDAWWUGD_CDS0085 [Salmonella phage SeKF_80]